MAIVDLGTKNIDVTNVTFIYNRFAFLRQNAYLIGCVLTGAPFDLYYSTLNVRFHIFLNSGLDFIAPDRPTLNIDVPVQTMYFAASPLFSDDGFCVVEITRRFLYNYGGETLPLSVQLLYDDAVIVPTWRG